MKKASAGSKKEPTTSESARRPLLSGNALSGKLKDLGKQARNPIHGRKGGSLLGLSGQKLRRRITSQDRAWLKAEGRQVASAWMTGGKFLLNLIHDEFSNDERWEVSPYYFSARDSLQPMRQRSTEDYKMIHLKNENEHKEVSHVFIFESGAVVTWGLNGQGRQQIEESLQKFHTRDGWPDRLQLRAWSWKWPIQKYRAWKWRLRGWDYSVFDRGKDPACLVAREDFDLDWEYATGFTLEDSKRYIQTKTSSTSWVPETSSFKTVNYWSEDQVAIWLRKRNLDSLAKTFKENKIDGSVLRKLTHEDIVTQLIPGNVGLQKKFEQELSEIRPRGLFTDKNKIVLDDIEDVDVLIAISLGLAQAAQLEVLTNQLDWMHMISQQLTAQLKEHGETYLDPMDLTKLLGYIQSLGHLLEDTSLEPNLRDHPEFLWDVSHVENQYNMTIEHLNFSEDLDHWREKWELVKENVAEDRDWTQEGYVAKLEMYIVIILLIELPSALKDLFELKSHMFS